MIFEETKLKGALIIRPERHEDERGFFARTFCLKEFADNGIQMMVAQSSVSFNKTKGTFRGMHFQAPPYSEAKIISCTQGSIINYIVDLRIGSATYGKWTAVELTAENRMQLFVPEMFANGFITLVPDTQVQYHMSQFYKADAARGFQWNDPAFDIQLPFSINAISEKDRSWPPFQFPEIFQLQRK